MTIAHVQTPAGGVQNSSATSVNLAFGSNVTANSLIVGGWRYSVGGETVTISDTLGNTWTSNDVQVVVSGDGNSTQGVGHAVAPAGGADTVTFAITGAAKNLRFAISEFSTTTGAVAFDGSSTATGSSTTPASGAVTPSVNGALLFCACHTANGVDYTAGTDFTINTTVPTTALGQRLATERYIQPTAASHDGTFTTTATPGAWGCVLSVFRETASSTGSTADPTGQRAPGTVGPFGFRQEWTGSPAAGSTDKSVNAEGTDVTATANDGTASVSPNAENAAVTATGNDPTSSVSPNAENAAVTVTANDGGADVKVNAENAAVTVAANDPGVLTGTLANAENAAVTVAANDPTSSVSPNAENAAVTVTANSPASSIAVNAENAAVTVAANDGTASIAVNAENAAVTVTANDPTVTTGSATNANAENAAVTVAANDPATSIKANAENAATAVTAETPTANPAPNAGSGAVTVVSNAAAVSLAVAAELAAVIAEAGDIQSSGGIVVLPDGRTYVVRREHRHIVVEAEDRTYVVRREHRHIVVEAEGRTYIIPYVNRTVRVPL